MLGYIFRSFAQLVDEPIVECIQMFWFETSYPFFYSIYRDIKQQTFIFILERIDIVAK